MSSLFPMYLHLLQLIFPRVLRHYTLRPGKSYHIDFFGRGRAAARRLFLGLKALHRLCTCVSIDEQVSMYACARGSFDFVYRERVGGAPTRALERARGLVCIPRRRVSWCISVMYDGVCMW